ncbi:MAG: 4Fe-4S dicluster domain-containing protein, partial [Planctomycetota bacterium]
MDTTACIGCRACQVACKSWHELPAEETTVHADHGGYQNPLTIGPRTFTVVGFHEIVDPAAPGGLRWIFSKRQCMHCLEPACVAACPVTALRKRVDGPVTYDEAKCIGCRYCVLACPFNVPVAEWDTTTPRIRKCDFCEDRLRGASTPDDAAAEGASWRARRRMPACAATCPTDALLFGPREEVLAEAWRRIETSPARYVRHVYGEREAGGTSWLYL